MAKHRRIWNASVYEKYMREGLGSGCGSNYTPWIRIQDFSSRGIASRVKGVTTGRVHHLMSNNELAYFYILDWSDMVTDIREQYPLSDLELAVRIASQAGIRYPVDRVSGYPFVMTCDFMITTIDGIKARTIKMTSELNNTRTLEKLEIERRYWLKQGIDWKIVTEREISSQKAKNIEWLYTALGIEDLLCESEDVVKARDLLLRLLRRDEYSIFEATQAIEREYMLISGMGMQLFKQLVLSRKIDVNLNEPLNITAKGIVA